MTSRLTRSICLAAGMCLLAAAPGPVAGSGDGAAQLVSGRGSITFGEEEDDDNGGHGVGFFNFRVVAGAEVSGSLLFAAEHHGYPDLIIRVESIENATVRRQSARLWAEGMLHDEPVMVRAWAFDGAGTARGDEFSIKCTNDNGEVAFSARGTLFRGDIAIGDAE
ncbi:MAG: hypothetical protein ACYSXF_08470 [Planctomycetota bacterium]|jgi:hypothetical protein